MRPYQNDILNEYLRENSERKGGNHSKISIEANEPIRVQGYLTEEQKAYAIACII